MITKTNFFQRLNDILTRPAMYGIQKVEDIKIIFFSEIFFNQNKEIEIWSNKFSHFVIEEINNHLHNFDWCKVIRLYSGSDAHSLELFKELCARFTEG
ncbi:MAG: hypothetical protein H6627_14945 [Calditrichae bacterium]|nr:hypothetical protein [Calditrichia bacterium]